MSGLENPSLSEDKGILAALAALARGWRAAGAPRASMRSFFNSADFGMRRDGVIEGCAGVDAEEAAAAAAAEEDDAGV